jgi:hypothetical protein
VVWKLDRLGRWLRHLLAKLGLADRVQIVVFAHERSGEARTIERGAWGHLTIRVSVASQASL